MVYGIQWIVNQITFPSPPSSYSLTSHPELFFIKNPKSRPGYPGVPCMLYAIPQGAPVLLVHAHSNGCDIGDMRQTLQSISEQLRVHVMSFEFPGYGLHVGTANMRSIDEAASTVLHFIRDELRVNLAQVVWYGRSIGSGPAMRIAHRITKEMKQQPGGLIIQCGYANFKEVARHLFGRVAKQLVSPLWPNEIMIRELHCPVLLIHGRADTMIPIEHSERLYNAVNHKELSRFHACDCGHNDFNFQRCTLRPIYDFLLGVISEASFPTTNFNIEIAPSMRAFVSHIGPLRTKIPVYSFRRPELDEWIRRLQAKKQPEIEAKEGDAAALGDRGPREAGQDDLEGRQVGASGGSGKSRSSQKPKKRGKAEPVNEPPPIPNFCDFPPLEDINEALLDPEGMIRTCALRVSAFLERLQQQLDCIDGLESKPLEEVIEFVEAEFWASDPLLCLWEEVRLPRGQWVRTRLGPFYVDSTGESGYDSGIGSGSASSPDLLRVPLWVFCPSSAHFRCLAEWSLLHSERLERNLPAMSHSSHGSTCCCVPCKLRKKKKPRGKRNPMDPNAHPTRGVLATSLAAHFVNWVDKTDEVKAIFSRFADLYRNPEQALGRSVVAVTAAVEAAAAAAIATRNSSRASGTGTAPASLNPAAPSGSPPAIRPQTAEDVPSDGPAPRPPKQSEAAEDLDNTAVSAISTPVAQRATGNVTEAFGQPLGVLCGSEAFLAPSPIVVPWWRMEWSNSAQDGQPVRAPWPASLFSTAARHLLRDSTGMPGTSLTKFYMSLWAPEQASEMSSSGTAVPSIGDFQSSLDMLSNHPTNVLPDRNADWIAGSLLLHYERLHSKASAGEAEKGSEQVSSVSHQLLGPEMRSAGLGVNKAMKVFAHAEHRERREHMRQRLRPTPKVPMPPDVGTPMDGEMAEKPAATANVTTAPPGVNERNTGTEASADRPSTASNPSSRAL